MVTRKPAFEASFVLGVLVVRRVIRPGADSGERAIISGMRVMIPPPPGQFRQADQLDLDQLLAERAQFESTELVQCACGTWFYPAPSERGGSRRVCSECRGARRSLRQAHDQCPLSGR